MPKVAVYNTAGSPVGEIELPESVFGIEPNADVMHEVVTAILANKRQGTQSALTRAEVRGGGKKPWRQKGTGRARHGSIRSPQWTHGGVVFAPKPRSYALSVNKKARRLAIRSALSTKALNGEVIVLDAFAIDAPKTKVVAAALKALNAEKALIVTPEKDDNLLLSARNIKNTAVTTADNLNVYDILKYEKFVILADAITKVEEVYAQ
ncbi:MAG: 50S ribosomal protein L4 [Christensenellales bacterium]|jgi:large subunit ribosomal protein L4